MAGEPDDTASLGDVGSSGKDRRSRTNLFAQLGASGVMSAALFWGSNELSSVKQAITKIEDKLDGRIGRIESDLASLKADVAVLKDRETRKDK